MSQARIRYKTRAKWHMGQGTKARKERKHSRGHEGREGHAARGWLSRVLQMGADLQIQKGPELTFLMYECPCDKCGAFWPRKRVSNN